MELLLLNKSFRPVRVVDQYESLLWNERYSEHGDFELYTSANSELLSIVKKGYYFYKDDADQQMIVEDIKIESDSESGNKLIISGRSLESILDRRIVWKKTNLNGSFQNGIKRLLDENIISPRNSKRAVPNFTFEYSDDPDILNLTISKQFTGDGLYDAIKEMCDMYQLGFRVRLVLDENDHLTDSDDGNVVDEFGNLIITGLPVRFVFSLYKGVDRSYDPMKDDVIDHLIDSNGDNVIDNEGNRIITAIPSGSSPELYPKPKLGTSFVVFSPDYDNVISNEYLESTKTLKNVTLVAGEDKGNSRRTRVVGTSAKGLERRELFTDARDIQSEKEDGTALTDKEYNKLLDERGKSKLAEATETTAFEYKVDPYLTYTYKEDYDKGDIVQVINEYGIRAKVRITEIVQSHDLNGFYIYPTFSSYSEHISDATSNQYGSGYVDDGSSSGGGSSSSSVLPAGGATGQVLTKRSYADYDTVWTNVENNPLPQGGTAGQFLVKNSSNNYDASWQTVATDRRYIHEQGSAESVWTINHNMNCYPSVTVVDSAKSTVIGHVQYIDTNNLTITFTAAFKGIAYLN